MWKTEKHQLKVSCRRDNVDHVFCNFFLFPYYQKSSISNRQRLVRDVPAETDKRRNRNGRGGPRTLDKLGAKNWWKRGEVEPTTTSSLKEIRFHNTGPKDRNNRSRLYYLSARCGVRNQNWRNNNDENGRLEHGIPITSVLLCTSTRRTEHPENWPTRAAGGAMAPLLWNVGRTGRRAGHARVKSKHDEAI